MGRNGPLVTNETSTVVRRTGLLCKDGRSPDMRINGPLFIDVRSPVVRKTGRLCKDGRSPDMRFVQNWERDIFGNRLTKSGDFDNRFKNYRIEDNKIIYIGYNILFYISS